MNVSKDLTGKTKSCPMCGSSEIHAEEYKLDFSGRTFLIKIMCANCGLNYQKSFVKNVQDPEKEILNYWNTRSYIC